MAESKSESTSTINRVNQGSIAQLHEHKHALTAITIAFAIYFITRGTHLLGEYWSGLVEHSMLTIIVVLIVHILDHMYLSRGSIRLIHEEFTPLKDAAQHSLTQLAATSASFAAMQDSGMTRIYSSRVQASEDIARELMSPDITKIRLIGISLNDFILENASKMNIAYQSIERRILQLASSEGSRASGDAEIAPQLDVRILLIHPFSYGAQQRHKAETRAHTAPPGRLTHDVDTVARKLVKLKLAVDELRSQPRQTTVDKIASGKGDSLLQDHASDATDQKAEPKKPSVLFDCRVYQGAPPLFLVWTDHSCFVEQYYYWSSRDAQSVVPVLRFHASDEPREQELSLDKPIKKNFHAEMAKHFDWIWENGSIEVEQLIHNHHVGYDMGLCQACAVNVYLDKTKTAKRIITLLNSAKDSSKVDIMGISLLSFADMRSEISEAFHSLLQNRSCDVRILCIDPECDQAKIRSYREAQIAQSDLKYEEYKDSPEYKASRLYHDTNKTIEWLNTLKGGTIQSGMGGTEKMTVKSRLQAWKYSCAPTCFVLRVDDVILYEPYSYGKVDPSTATVTLSGDMPVFEFHVELPDPPLFEPVKKRNPWKLLNDHFQFVSSISGQAICEINKEAN